MNDRLENVKTELNEASDRLDDWAERTGAKMEDDAAAAGRRLAAANTREKARAQAQTAKAKVGLETRKAELKKAAEQAAQRANEAKAKFPK